MLTVYCDTYDISKHTDSIISVIDTCCSCSHSHSLQPHSSWRPSHLLHSTLRLAVLWVERGGGRRKRVSLSLVWFLWATFSWSTVLAPPQPYIISQIICPNWNDSHHIWSKVLANWNNSCIEYHQKYCNRSFMWSVFAQCAVLQIHTMVLLLPMSGVASYNTHYDHSSCEQPQYQQKHDHNEPGGLVEGRIWVLLKTTWGRGRRGGGERGREGRERERKTEQEGGREKERASFPGPHYTSIPFLAVWNETILWHQTTMHVSYTLPILVDATCMSEKGPIPTDVLAATRTS